MSKAKEALRKKFKKCDVQHHYCGGESHLFFITSPTGKKYNVGLRIGCDCDFMQKKSKYDNKLCSHCLAVLDKIVEEVGFNGFWHKY